ncbi:MAG: DUF4863 family protein [Spongiibacteraceae bacterium]|nr:DUF4863 family protein [Spongiibacteraceae bacterium]
MSTFSLSHYQDLLKTITNNIKNRQLNQALEEHLNQQFPASSELFKAIETASHAGIASGDLCQHKAGGISYGRVIKPCPELSGFSIDLVQMKDVVGPHHRHPQGEIDLIMPISAQAKFDNYGAGWRVYGPDSAHCPTVTEGEALVLYLLPGGEIEFTRN